MEGSNMFNKSFKMLNNHQGSPIISMAASGGGNSEYLIASGSETGAIVVNR